MPEDRTQAEPVVRDPALAGAAPAADAQAAADRGATGGPAKPPAENGDGFFARLANAWKGFWQGWRGELLEIPEGEEGTVSLGQLRALERQLGRKLDKAQAATQAAQEESSALGKRIIELEAAAKEGQRELKRARASAEESEKSLQAELAKLQGRLQEREAAIAAGEAENARLKKTISERDVSLAAARRELETAREQSAQRSAEFAENAQKAFQDAQRREEQLRRDADASLARLGDDLAARENSLAQLNAKLEENSAAHAGVLASLKKELDTVREALAQREAANDMLLTEVSEQESAAEQAQEDASRTQAELKEEIERLETQLKTSEQAKEKLRSELIAALPEKVAAADLRLKMSVAEKDYQRKVGEADLLREDVRELRKRIAEYEGKVGGLEQTESQRAGLQRELQRQAAQLDAIRGQLEEARLQSEKLRAAVQEFHAPAVSAVQVAGVYAETVAGSLALSESDRADIIEIRQNMEALRLALQKLATKLAETDSGRTNS